MTCGKQWTTAHPTGAGTLPHACVLTAGHSVRHYCECGAVK